MATERLLSLLRLLSPQQFVSGTDLAARLGLSRASIHLILQSAESLGINIERVPGRGYRLQQAISWLDAAVMQAALDGAWQIEIQPVIDSTNAELLRRPSLTHPFCLAAELQTAGRGRRGRPWSGAVGGSLLFSVAWPFAMDVSRLSGLSLVVGLALAEALDSCGVPRVQLKWPNDVMVDFRKLAGVLIEVQAEVNSHCRAIIGIGLNVQLPAAVRDDIDQAVVDLAQLLPGSIDRNQLLAAILRALAVRLGQFAREGFAACRAEWELRHAYHGQLVNLHSPDGRLVEGRVAGLGDNGQLLLESAGTRHAIHVGELSLRRAVR